MLGIRMVSQSLTGPRPDAPEQVVERMGAVQAQEIRAAKWAVGLRTARPELSAVERSLREGKILRMHVMRPTWHYVPARDVKWMAALSEKSLKSALNGYSRVTGVGEQDYNRHKDLLLKLLEGRCATKTEIAEEFVRRGVGAVEPERFTAQMVTYGEAEGIICSGPEVGGKHTYALTRDRVPDPVELSREEALAELARRYFRGHGPATIEDFIWWSGLGVRQARSAVASLGQEITAGTFNGREMYFHAGSPEPGTDKNIVRLLPPFDEYLISYKNRLDCIREDHTRHAYNNFGIFLPVVLHNGRITGNWRRSSAKGVIDTAFFPGCRPAAKRSTEKAVEQYMAFIED